MKMLLVTITYLIFILPVFAEGNRVIRSALREHIAGKGARIGVVVIINSKDTVPINGNRDFPMMNVVKLPLALTAAHWINDNDMSLNNSVASGENDLSEDTYSPILKIYSKSRNVTTARGLFEWPLIESDDNAADILLKRIGGTSGATSLVRQLNISDEILIGASEEDMHRDPYLSYLNRTTSLVMARLFDRFYIEMRNTSRSYSEISSMLEQCSIGHDRLAVPLLPTSATIGHKAGTGFPTPDGRVSAINDCGCVKLPDSTRYSTAVFVADSGYDMGATSAIIVGIFNIVWEGLTEHENKREYGTKILSKLRYASR